MTDIKTDPTLAEWIGIHDELILIVNKLIAIQDHMGKMDTSLIHLSLTIGIVADREY